MKNGESWPGEVHEQGRTRITLREIGEGKHFMAHFMVHSVIPYNTQFYVGLFIRKNVYLYSGGVCVCDYKLHIVSSEKGRKSKPGVG